MALSPGIPTSFVPKQPVQPTVRRPMSSGSNVFLIFSLAVVAITVIIAGAVFAYSKYLNSTLASKQAELAEAQSKVDQNTIEDFVRLRDRLTNGKDLLMNHVMLSQFFDDLEGLTLQNVRFDTMKLTVAGDHTAKLQMKGTAKNFNALAAQSNAFASDKRIKRAIFSDISLSADKLVTFTLTADIDSKLITEGATVTSTRAAPAAAAAAAAAPTQATAATTSAPVRPAAVTTPVTAAAKLPTAPATATTTH